jgi:hypothetical protein
MHLLLFKINFLFAYQLLRIMNVHSVVRHRVLGEELRISGHQVHLWRCVENVICPIAAKNCIDENITRDRARSGAFVRTERRESGVAERNEEIEKPCVFTDRRGCWELETEVYATGRKMGRRVYQHGGASR